MANDAQVCREGDNRISAMRIPIIFVPGIMGSRVRIPSMSDAWDPDSKKMNMYIHWSHTSAVERRRRLDFANPGEVFTEPSRSFDNNHSDRVARGWGGVCWDSYGVFLEFLESCRFGAHRTPVYAYGYDWRQPIIQLGCQLAADITGEAVKIGGNAASPSPGFASTGGVLGIEQADKCIIITHSMGGLVTRTALKDCPSLQQKTVGVLHGVQPATGAPAMYRRLITGAYAPYDGAGFAEGVLHRILGSTGDDFCTLCSVIPGAMQLLPSDLYRKACRANGVYLVSWTCFEEDRKTSHWIDESVYETYNRSHTDNPPGVVRSTLDPVVQEALRQRIKGVKRFHNYLGEWKYDDRTWTFYGTACNTDSTVHFDLPPRSIKTRRAGGVLGIGAKTVYETSNSSGQTVTLDAERDILRHGYNPAAPHDAQGTLSGYGPHGDGTVPEISGSALFGLTRTEDIQACNCSDFRQFYVRGLEHEPAYRNREVQEFVRAWISYVIAIAAQKE